MAKKSKKKSCKAVCKYIPFLLLLLSVVVVLMGFLAGVKYVPENGDKITYTLFEVTFGKKVTGVDLGVILSGTSKINFSFLALLGLFLPLVGGIVVLFVKGKIGGLVATLCFIASAVLLFLVPSITKITSEVSSGIIGGTTKSANTFKELGYSLGVGSILGGIVSCIGALISLFHTATVK